MKIFFNIQYATTFGEILRLNVVGKGKDIEKVYSMNTYDGKSWHCEITAENGMSQMEYYYSVENGDSEVRHEWTTVSHRLELNAKRAMTYFVNDRWNDIPYDSYLYSSAFTDCVNRRHREPAKGSDYNQTLRLIVRAPQLRSGSRLALVGEDNALGRWNPDDAISMVEHNYNEWVADINVKEMKKEETEFKFIAFNEKGGVDWETGMNRQLHAPTINDGEVVVTELDQAFFELCDEKLAGTLIPVFSLRSKGSFGVGDFGDLKMMIDWVAETNQRVLQVLPINDTTSTHTWTDSYPYSAISIFALHPQFADFRQLPEIKDKKKAREMEALRKELNELKQIDYERVNNTKTDYLRIIFKQEGEAVMKGEDFKMFVKENEHWLVPYAQYCHLRDSFGNVDFSSWKGHEQWHEADRKKLTDPKSKEYADVAFYYYVQFVLDRQMRAAHEYAMARGVILKGDIPIGVDRNGCDVWHEPQYFNLNSQAGAPPDAFSINGQNWGFPTYNWQRMIDDGCEWWIRRFQNMAKYFDAYRIDHVLGFFRIWAIPTTCVHGLLGQFAPSLGMTREEIEGYGLHFQEELFTTPFIARWVVDRVFGIHADEVVEKYLDHKHDDIFALKPEYDTERKIEAVFKGKDSMDDVWVRDGLYALVSDVLFVRDDNDPNKFHPRITAQLNFMYEALYDSDKEKFNRLYNDYYYRRNNNFWYNEAMKKLPVLVQATRMLVCAEDLGMVPDCVAWVMDQLRILSLELQQMPKDPKVKFGILSRNPYRSVCTLSTHDMPTLRQWWDEDYERTQVYYSSMLYRGGAAPHPLPGWLARDIIANQLTCPSMLCILSLQDWFALDEKLRLPDADAERINIPANPRHYWRYRMHINIEDLIADKEYNDAIKELVKLR
ncbi:MAG: 4-alpha-glucanotransferase [Prevotella pectinovora]|uniref:4-alpha-glucanotransferase n=1 Tax=Prevotella pectinovora TaxID=1602169 RepID=UPI002A68CBFE|nr:4-alpha-glucanotransferase [Prevotella pectinovora]MDD7744077.1 4-alpha-glucanotransferase [Prevotella pectinovora]MEE1545767.1 4-alpha-glucanotransferase [Prevotella pectinovora]